MTPSKMSSHKIKQILLKNGCSVYSVRKQKRMIGGQRYDFHGGLRQGNCSGKPYYFYKIELKSPASQDDYNLAKLFLEDAGYQPKYHPFHNELTINAS